MLRIRKLQHSEFTEYRRIAITEYQQDLIESQYFTKESAQKKAQESIDEAFPNGYIASHCMLQCIEFFTANETQLIGYIWYNFQHDGSAFILDFYLFEAHQNKGIGQQVMALVDQQAKEQGATSIGLRVAPNNARALALYKKVGFQATGINMVKHL